MMLHALYARVLLNVTLPVCSALVWIGSDRKLALSVSFGHVMSA